MNNPLEVVVPKGAWLKVATNVTTGTIHILKKSAMYQQTYRLSGAAAPVAQEEGAELESPKEGIEASAGIDVYIYCTSQDGRIRVDV